MSFTVASGGADILATVAGGTYLSENSGGVDLEYSLAIDLNNDGLTDMVTTGPTSMQQVWLNNGGGFTKVTSAGIGNPLNGISILNLAGQNNKVVTHLVIGDFDGDGDQDIFDSYNGQYNIQQVAPPAVSSSTLSDNGTLTSASLSAVIDFNETIASAGSRVIELHQSSDGLLLESVPANDARVTLNGTQVTITFNTTLLPNTGYYILVQKRAFFDADGMTFPGITSSSALNFSTAMVLPLTLIDLKGSRKAGTVQLS